MKKTIALLCALAMLLTTAISCGKTTAEDPAEVTTAATAPSADTEATAPAETEAPKAFDSVPAQDLGGEFNILYSTTDQSVADFQAETQTGDLKNDLIFLRNSMVRE